MEERANLTTRPNYTVLRAEELWNINNGGSKLCSEFMSFFRVRKSIFGVEKGVVGRVTTPNMILLVHTSEWCSRGVLFGCSCAKQWQFLRRQPPGGKMIFNDRPTLHADLLPHPQQSYCPPPHKKM